MKSLLKPFQSDSSKALIDYCKQIIESLNDPNKIVALQAPTGAGKTVIMSDFMESFPNELEASNLNPNVAFVWISVGTGNLHEQSCSKIIRETGRGSLFDDAIKKDNRLKSRDVLVLSWESMFTTDDEGKFTNVIMKSRDGVLSLPQFLENTRDAGVKIILIIDESHRNETEISTKIIEEVVQPIIQIDVSATNTSLHKTNYIHKISYAQVAESQLVKKKAILNDGEDHSKTEGKDLLDIVESRRQAIAKEYEQMFLDTSRPVSKRPLKLINPLVLIQLENDKDTDLYEYKKILESKGIKNEEIAVWLSSVKENNKNIDDLDNPVKYLFFKQAIATGWDCPRACILVKLRDLSNDNNFEIQTLGRTLRMPEQKHYDNYLTDNAFVYSNFSSYKIPADVAVVQANVKKRVEDSLQLPGQRYKLQFTPPALTNEEAFDIVKSQLDDTFDDIETKNADNFQNILDSAEAKYSDSLILKKTGNTLSIQENFQGIDLAVNKILSGFMGKYGSKGLVKKIKEYIKRLLEESGKINADDNDFETKALITILDESNLNFLKQALQVNDGQENNVKVDGIEDYIFNFDKKEIESTESILERVEKYESKYFHDKCYLKAGRSKPEKVFEDRLHNAQDVVWWLKNYDDNTGFGIKYIEDGTERIFRPDYIVKIMSNNVEYIGLFDTKSGSTAKSSLVKAKALSDYSIHGKNLVKGIIACPVTDKDGSKLYFHDGENYEYKDDNSFKNDSWTLLGNKQVFSGIIKKK